MYFGIIHKLDTFSLLQIRIISYWWPYFAGLESADYVLCFFLNWIRMDYIVFLYKYTQLFLLFETSMCPVEYRNR